MVEALQNPPIVVARGANSGASGPIGCPVRRIPFLRMAGRHHGLDVAPDVEVTDDLHEAGIEQADEVIQDSINRRFEEDHLVTELVDVDLERFELDELY